LISPLSEGSIFLWPLPGLGALALGGRLRCGFLDHYLADECELLLG